MRPFAVLLLAVSPVAALALPSPEEVRSMAYAGQVDSVEAAFTLTHRASVAGEVPFDDVRALVEALMVTDPAIVAFTEAWLAQRPGSPYARSVRAFQLYGASFALRGDAMPRWAWPAGLDGFRAMQAEGMELALAAYRAAPDLVAASDAVFRFNLVAHRLDGPALRLMVADVMEATPSRRSLARALDSSSPAWGGEGPALMAEFCDAYADRVVDAEGYDVETCIADNVLDHGYGADLEAAAAEFVLAQMNPILADDRLTAAALRPDLGQGEMMREALESGASDDLAVADAYDRDVALPQGLPPLLPTVLARAQAAARQDLVTDPFDADSLDILTRTEDAFGQAIPGTVEGEALRRLLAQRVRATPFDPEAWVALGDATENWPDLTVGGGEPMWINAVVYSNHAPYYLASLLSDQLLTFEAALANHGTGFMSDEDFAWVLAATYCPMVRAERLYVAACEAAGADEAGCRGPFSIKDRMADVLAGLPSRPECPGERDAPLAEIAYAPVDVALE